jgi:hypothetical protein
MVEYEPTHNMRTISHDGTVDIKLIFCRTPPRLKQTLVCTLTDSLQTFNNLTKCRQKVMNELC